MASDDGTPPSWIPEDPTPRELELHARLAELSGQAAEYIHLWLAPFPYASWEWIAGEVMDIHEELVELNGAVMAGEGPA